MTFVQASSGTGVRFGRKSLGFRGVAAPAEESGAAHSEGVGHHCRVFSLFEPGHCQAPAVF